MFRTLPRVRQVRFEVAFTIAHSSLKQGPRSGKQLRSGGGVSGGGVSGGALLTLNDMYKLWRREGKGWKGKGK